MKSIRIYWGVVLFLFFLEGFASLQGTSFLDAKKRDTYIEQRNNKEQKERERYSGITSQNVAAKHGDSVHMKEMPPSNSDQEFDDQLQEAHQAERAWQQFHATTLTEKEEENLEEVAATQNALSHWEQKEAFFEEAAHREEIESSHQVKLEELATACQQVIKAIQGEEEIASALVEPLEETGITDSSFSMDHANKENHEISFFNKLRQREKKESSHSLVQRFLKTLMACMTCSSIMKHAIVNHARSAQQMAVTSLPASRALGVVLATSLLRHAVADQYSSFGMYESNELSSFFTNYLFSAPDGSHYFGGADEVGIGNWPNAQFYSYFGTLASNSEITSFHRLGANGYFTSVNDGTLFGNNIYLTGQMEGITTSSFKPFISEIDSTKNEILNTWMFTGLSIGPVKNIFSYSNRVLHCFSSRNIVFEFNPTLQKVSNAFQVTGSGPIRLIKQGTENSTYLLTGRSNWLSKIFYNGTHLNHLWTRTLSSTLGTPQFSDFAEQNGVVALVGSLNNHGVVSTLNSTTGEVLSFDSINTGNAHSGEALSTIAFKYNSIDELMAVGTIPLGGWYASAYWAALINLKQKYFTSTIIRRASDNTEVFKVATTSDGGFKSIGALIFGDKFFTVATDSHGAIDCSSFLPFSIYSAYTPPTCNTTYHQIQSGISFTSTPSNLQFEPILTSLFNVTKTSILQGSSCAVEKLLYSIGTPQPSLEPTPPPVIVPTSRPSLRPLSFPTFRPRGLPTGRPSTPPTAQPSNGPSASPSVSPTSQPSNTPSTSPSNTPSASPSNHPTVNPSAFPSSQPSKFFSPAIQKEWTRWFHQMNLTSLGNLVLQHQGVIACGGSSPSSCLYTNQSTGAFITRYNLPWDLTTAAMKVGGQLILGGLLKKNSILAYCDLEKNWLACDYKTLATIQTKTAIFNEAANQIIIAGSDLLNRPTVALCPPASANCQQLTYQTSALKSFVLTALGSNAESTQSATAGSGVNNNMKKVIVLAANSIAGDLKSFFTLTPYYLTIQNENNLVNAVTMDPHQGFFVGGGIATNDNTGMHAYIAKVNGVLNKLSYAIRFFGKGTSKLKDLILKENDRLIAICDTTGFAPQANQFQLALLEANATTGEILNGARVSGPGDITCNKILASSDGFNIACNLNKSQPLLFHVSHNFSFELPSGYESYNANRLYSGTEGFEFIPTPFRFDLTPLPTPSIVVTKSTLLMINPGVFNFSSLDWLAPTFTPTRKPTVLVPTTAPVPIPTTTPSLSPSSRPSTFNPTSLPTSSPTISQPPTGHPSSSVPTTSTNVRTTRPTKPPTQPPTKAPTRFPTQFPTRLPTNIPSFLQTFFPTAVVTTPQPSSRPPTKSPTFLPSLSKSRQPIPSPTVSPSPNPSTAPTQDPTDGTSKQEQSYDQVKIAKIAFGSAAGGLITAWCVYKAVICCKNAQKNKVFPLQQKREKLKPLMIKLPTIEDKKAIMLEEAKLNSSDNNSDLELYLEERMHAILPYELSLSDSSGSDDGNIF